MGKEAFETTETVSFKGFFIGRAHMDSLVNPSTSDSIDIKGIIESESLLACFQQIISVSRNTVLGLEGLIRGIDPDSGELIPPRMLFAAARKAKLSLELDRACREAILKEFGKIHPCDREKFLFLNIDATVLETCIGSGYLLRQVGQYNIDPRNVVIEISEKSMLGNATLKEFADTYKRYDFLVALDDVGTGFSNMDRILLVKPNIIKIDASLVKNLHNDFYKQGVFKSLVIMANKIGALVIAEGVETEEEAIQVLRLGGHMIQGYFFSIPERLSDADVLFSNHKIACLGNRFNQYMNLQYTKEKTKYRQLNRLVKESVERLTGKSRAEFEAELRKIVAGCSTMECAYILDGAGVQISRTVCADIDADNRKNLIFYSAREGTDHSMEKYYYPLVSANRKRYTTEPYISLATGNLCVTVSAVFQSAEQAKCILCADFKASEDFYNIELRGPVIDAGFGSKPDISGLLSKMSEEIHIDSLTGAYNRRYIEERLLVDIYNAGMDQQPLTVILADIDRFKNINDIYGHPAGDMVLKEFVAISKNFIRKDTDWIARYGGDEFLLVLKNADKTVAERVSEKIRSACEQTSVPYENSLIRFTASLGACTSRDRNQTPEALIRFSDKNLYRAKNAGRNQVVHKATV